MFNFHLLKIVSISLSVLLSSATFAQEAEQNGQCPIVEFLPPRVNPFNNSITLTLLRKIPVECSSAYLVITDSSGNELQKTPIELDNIFNNVTFYYNDYSWKSLVFTLYIDGNKVVAERLKSLN
ncbi:MAG: hypothetical protein COA57_13635 [Flavobacteriales bacterium]|nr:MAG: hypothetical protein COA57_13635 [Flavobacteriales bacterium]